MGSTLAQDGDKLFIDNKGVTTCAASAPTRECEDMDLLQTVYNNLSTKSIDVE